LHLFTENLNATKMVKIYVRALLPCDHRWFRRRREYWLPQEDNDPKHRSRLCTTWKMENDVDVLGWSSQPPYANPIENLWALLKLKLRGKKIWNIKQLYHYIQLTRRSFFQEYAIKLGESMGQRCEAIIDNGGGWTKYWE
jgi:hypothetical protein